MLLPILKKRTISALKRIGVYHRLRSSIAFDLYSRVANGHVVEDRDREVDFYRFVLIGFERGGLIFDIGANVGAKADTFLRLGARVVAAEPDEHNQAILRERFLRFRLTPQPVTIVPKAVSETEGAATMWVDTPGSALNTLSQKWADALKADKKRFEETPDPLVFAQKKIVETTTLERLIDLYGLPFFIKIDVEGCELKVLQGLRRVVPYLSFEVNLPEFRQEGLQCIELLGKLESRGQFNFTSDCRRGLALEKWGDGVSFAQILGRSNDKCVEVFWRTHRKES